MTAPSSLSGSNGLILVFLSAAVLSTVGTGLVRRYAISRSLLDLPNHRSSHVVPTPRGGGLALVIIVLAATLLATLATVVPLNVGVAIVGGGTLIAAIGWIDDRRSVPARIRAGTHFAAAIWGVAWLRGLPDVQFGPHHFSLGVFGAVLAVLGTVWLTNLYNFMDGIDGIAGVTALTASLFGAAVLSGAGENGLASLPIVIAGASLGFLVWNWPPARVFMGDIGSGFLGFVFALLGLASERQVPGALAIWVLLLGVFVVDTTITLFRRVARGERWYDAHRSHAYQRLVQSGYRHRSVTLTVALLNCLLGAAALSATSNSQLAPVIAAVALAALMVAYALVERRQPMPPAIGTPN